MRGIVAPGLLSPDRILALFGERVTMQYMSQSIGWEDCVVLAMCPLGIITIIISAIRVGGPKFLKSLIGRARENMAMAEMELMSSTSEETCEMYNGQSIVRCQGVAPVLEFICLWPKDFELDDMHVTDDLFEFMTLEEATGPKGLMRMLRHGTVNAPVTTKSEGPPTAHADSSKATASSVVVPSGHGTLPSRFFVCVLIASPPAHHRRRGLCH
jgi:hypothetical protein